MIGNRVLSVAAAVAAAGLVWVAFELIGGVDLRAPQPGNTGATDDAGIGIVLGSSAVASLAGWALLAVLEKVTARARMIWTVVAIVVLVLSLGAPLSAAGLTALNKTALALMHVAVGVTLIPLLRRTSKPDVAAGAPTPGAGQSAGR